MLLHVVAEPFISVPTVDTSAFAVNCPPCEEPKFSSSWFLNPNEEFGGKKERKKERKAS